MRFNKEDLRKGNVSKERIEEIVLRSVLKIDPTLHNEEEALRNSTKLIADVEKIFLFKPAHIASEEENRAVTILENRIKDLSFFTKLSIANKLILDQERSISYAIKENKKKEYILALGRLESLRTTALIQEQNYIAQIRQIEKERQAILVAEAYLAQKHLEELKGYRDSLKRANIEHNKNIKAARLHYSNEIMKNIDDVNVNGVRTFEGTSTAQKKGFTYDLMAIEEIENRKLARIDHQIAKLESILKNIESTASDQTGTMFNFQKHKAGNANRALEIKNQLSELRAQRLQVQRDAHLAKIRIGDIYQIKHINSTVSIHECNAHLNAFERQNKVHLDRFRETVQNEQHQILRNNKEILIAERDIAVITKNKKVKIAQEEVEIKERNKFIKEYRKIEKDLERRLKETLEDETDKNNVKKNISSITTQALAIDEEYKLMNLEFSSSDSLDVDIPVSFGSLELPEFPEELNLDDFPDLSACEFEQIGEPLLNNRSEFRSDLRVR